MDEAPENPARCPECESVRISVQPCEQPVKKTRKKFVLENMAWCQACNWRGKFSELILCGTVPMFGKIRCPRCEQVHLLVDSLNKEVRCLACKWKGTIDEVSFVHPEMVNA